MKALIIYHSKTGHTRAAADDIARGLDEKGVEVTIEEAAKADPAKASDYDILLVGSPTYAQTRYKAAAKPVEHFMDAMKPDALSGHLAGGFSVCAASGAEKDRGRDREEARLSRRQSGIARAGGQGRRSTEPVAGT